MEGLNARNAAGTPVWAIKALAAVVTADVFITIVRHWTGFDLVSKFLAVALLANLVALPAASSWGRIKRYEWQSLFPAYLLLMLATSLFGMR
jgi:hypothetical protein